MWPNVGQCTTRQIVNTSWLFTVYALKVGQALVESFISVFAVVFEVSVAVVVVLFSTGSLLDFCLHVLRTVTT